MIARIVVAAVGVALSVCSVAQAQSSWTGYTPPTPSGVLHVPGVPGGVPYTSLSGNEFVVVGCGSNFSSAYACANGGTTGGLHLPIAAFARASDLAAAAAALETRLGERFENNLAAASSISFIAPPDGAMNRLGLGAASIGDSTGVSLSYFRRLNGADIAFGAGRAGSSTALKTSVGISW